MRYGSLVKFDPDMTFVVRWHGHTPIPVSTFTLDGVQLSRALNHPTINLSQKV